MVRRRDNSKKVLARTLTFLKLRLQRILRLFSFFSQPFQDGGRYHIESSPALQINGLVSI